MNHIKHNIPKIYLYNFFHGLMFAYVIERLFWAERGISVVEVVYLEIIYSMIIVGLELPTGMLADRYSRKVLIVIDAVTAFLEFMILIFATNFWHFTLAIGLSAVGHTLQSGAHNALVHDSLKTVGQESQFEKVLGRINAFDYSGIIIGALVGGFIASRHPLVTTYWISLISLVIAFLIALTLRETTLHEKNSETWGAKEWLEIVKFMINRRNVFAVTIIGMITGGVVNFLDEFWQIYLQAIEIPVILFGPIEVLGFGAVAIGGLMAYRFKENTRIARLFLIATSFMLFGYVWMVVFRNPVGIIALVVIYFASAILEPILMGYLHEHAIPKYRATIESAYSVMSYLSIAVIGLPFGFISTNYNIFAGFIYLAGLLTILLLTMPVMIHWLHQRSG